MQFHHFSQTCERLPESGQTLMPAGFYRIICHLLQLMETYMSPQRKDTLFKRIGKKKEQKKNRDGTAVPSPPVDYSNGFSVG